VVVVLIGRREVGESTKDGMTWEDKKAVVTITVKLKDGARE